MVHYPQQIIRHGPLIRSWTMRHEGKLNFFKQASKSSNFKNITLSLARRHQLWLLYQFQTSSLLDNEIIRGPIIRCNQLCEEETKTQTLMKNHLTSCHINDQSLITRLKWIKVNGLKYLLNNAYLVTAVEEDEPTFSKLTDIVLVDSSIILVFYYKHCNTTY